MLFSRYKLSGTDVCTATILIHVTYRDFMKPSTCAFWHLVDARCCITFSRMCRMPSRILDWHLLHLPYLLCTPWCTRPLACTLNYLQSMCKLCLGILVQPWGIEGWRVAMRAVSLVSFIVGLGVALIAVDPREHLRTSSSQVKPRTGMLCEGTSATVAENACSNAFAPCIETR